ncbi:N-acetyltransferase family protein [Maritalea sp. S77]|uniref:GNAT family N-acetyltransferase n=1 Tax=Maritalea sp. S77 TaxID=3415125 RepID=UPI003C7D68FE
MSQANLSFRRPTPADGEQIAQIHKMGLDTGHASFRETALTWPEFETNYLTGRSLAFLACANDIILGWASIAPSSPRAVYAGVGEISIYLHLQARGRGVGSALMQEIIGESEKKGFWTLFAHIFPENPASIALHAKAGFETIGRRKAIGKMAYGHMAGKWRDVILMERRSKIVGLD